VVSMAGARLGGWEGAGLIPSIEPTSSGAATELSSASTPAAGAVDCRAGFRVVLGWGSC
jgi:hypothetical protein